MPTYTSYDGTELAYRVEGSGEPLVVWPGGPARDAAYLGDLGGLADAARLSLVIPDPRGTGASPRPADPTGYAATRLADDLEALRTHLGLDTMDLLGHSAGGSVAELYAARHPARLRRLVLVTPGTAALGLDITDDEWDARVALRATEPWFAGAKIALEADDGTPATRQAMSPFLYGAWSDAARHHAASDDDQRNREGTRAFWAEQPDPEQTRRAIGAVTAPVRVIVGELDLMPGPGLGEQLAALFADGRCLAQPGAGHFPWVDDPELFARLVVEALAD
ncbi:alpha/beta hydrolase [Intrasporangium sp. YIM S08009]|uniref:alpha/beta fold hydrolase n=1 Tax=Intrasporangium zincisolvens TaxID=3080018 RepID=UPI002B06194E|nr:alpha/beta hydrolase [Intrasporangium sp. YIM S08009]